MKIRIKSLLLLFLLIAGMHAMGIPTKEITEKVKACVYEVVVPKVEDEDVTYERPLPKHLLPYKVRNDKYSSIGSAFAIGENRFLTAAHVLNLDDINYYDDLYIRDNNGNIYEIDQIWKYSSNRDMAMFSVKEITTNAYMQLSADIDKAMNQEVFAVGNALGEGVVIRDGLLTSKTPEDENGTWQWLRFSAAASPGNSGGPLLNKDGEVLGIVLMKSANENLNYALPVTEYQNFPANTGLFHKRVTFSPSNMKKEDTTNFEYTVLLPKSYKKVKQEIYFARTNNYKSLQKEYLKKYAAYMFPRGKGSTEIMQKAVASYVPAYIEETQDNILELNSASFGEKKFDKNGSVYAGIAAAGILMTIDKPDGVTVKKLWDDSKYYMDYLLKAFPLNRQIGKEEIDIVSIGYADSESIHTDRFGRKWKIRVYRQKYNELSIITFSLPTPMGITSIIRLANGQVFEDKAIRDVKYIADYAILLYSGRFDEWRQFLTYKDLLPADLSKLSFEYEQYSKATIHADTVSFNYTSEIQDIYDSSILTIGYSFSEVTDNITLTERMFMIMEDENSANSVIFGSELKPDRSLDNDYHYAWQKMTSKKYPYDGSVTNAGGATVAIALHPEQERLSAHELRNSEKLYTIMLIKEGEKDKSEFKKTLNNLLSVKRPELDIKNSIKRYVKP